MKVEIYCKDPQFLKHAFNVNELKLDDAITLADGTEVRVSRLTGFKSGDLTLIELTLNFGMGVVGGVLSNWLYDKIKKPQEQEKKDHSPENVKEIVIAEKKITNVTGEQFLEITEKIIHKTIRK